MAKNKKEINDFCKEYISLNEYGTNICGITEYKCIDDYKVEKDQDKIISFLINNFSINSVTIEYENLTFNEKGERWTNVSSLSDIDILNKLIALGIACGLFKENLTIRLNIIELLKNYGKYLNPESFNLDDPIILESYLKVFREHVLPIGYIEVDKDHLSFYGKRKNFSDAEIRELILYWWNVGNYPPNPKVIKKFNELLENRLHDLLDAIVYLNILGQSAATLNMNLDLNPQVDYFIDDIQRHLETASEAILEDFEIAKEELLTSLKKLKDENDKQNKKHL